MLSGFLFSLQCVLGLGLGTLLTECISYLLHHGLLASFKWVPDVLSINPLGSWGGGTPGLAAFTHKYLYLFTLPWDRKILFCHSLCVPVRKKLTNPKSHHSLGAEWEAGFSLSTQDSLGIHSSTHCPQLPLFRSHQPTVEARYQSPGKE